MIDVNWDFAPEGAEELVQFESHVTWRKGIKIWCMVQQGWCDYVSDFKAIAARPKQTKTVADAVDGLWVEDNNMATLSASRPIIGFNPAYNVFFSCESDYNFSDNNDGEYLVGTFEQFEAYVKEQEGEKWTHEYDNSNPRRLKIICDKPDVNGEIAVIVNGPKGAFYTKTLPSKIRLIKPTITKAEAWDRLLQTDERIRKLDDAIFAIADKYDII